MEPDVGVVRLDDASARTVANTFRPLVSLRANRRHRTLGPHRPIARSVWTARDSSPPSFHYRRWSSGRYGRLSIRSRSKAAMNRAQSKRFAPPGVPGPSQNPANLRCLHPTSAHVTSAQSKAMSSYTHSKTRRTTLTARLSSSENDRMDSSQEGCRSARKNGGNNGCDRPRLCYFSRPFPVWPGTAERKGQRPEVACF